VEEAEALTWTVEQRERARYLAELRRQNVHGDRQRRYVAIRPYVPTVLLARLLVEFASHLTRQELGFMSGLGEKRIYEIEHCVTVNTRFDTADRIISLGLGAPELWWDVPELREIYEAVT
jgi:hypothetical protein